MKADLRSQHDLGAIVGYAYRLYAMYFPAFFLIALITAPIELLSIVLQRQIENDDASQAVGVLMQAPAIPVGLLAAAALVHAVHDATGGTPADAGRSLDAAFERAWAVFSTALLFAGLLVCSLFAAPFLAAWWLFRKDATIDGGRNWWLALVPGALFLYLALRWGFNVQGVMLEGRRNWAALDVSAAAVRGSWWRAFGILIVVALIQLGPMMIASLSSAGSPLVEGTVTAIAGSLVLPFAAAAQTLLYYDLKARKHLDINPARIDTPEPDVQG